MIRGRVSVHPRGFGFLRREGDGLPASAFVPPPQLKSFLAGDLVDGRLVEEPDGRFSSADLELVSRWREELFGRLVRRRGRAWLQVDARVGNSDWPLTQADDIAEGTPLVARIDGQEVRFLRAVPEEQAGLVGILVGWGIRGEQPAECLAAAETASVRWGERRDLREVPTVTIDAPHSKDLDDALSALPAQSDGAVRVLVSIADVDAAVSQGSVLDLEARRRGTSVYLPGHVIPMLPRALSEKALSLLPGEERAALTVELRIDPRGDVTAVDIVPSRIRSHARLSYEQVRTFLDDGDEAAVPAEVRETVRWLRTAASRISAVRAARGGVNLERDEVRLVIENGEPVEVEARELNSAHRLVERLMVAANEAVARWLMDRGLPGLFRVQDEPDPRHVASLSEFARNFGFETGFGERLDPRSLTAFEEQFQSSALAPQVRTVLRRVLGRARYTVHPGPHFGLASPGYLHFTSPIRRYSDLSVHRVLKAHLAGDREQRAGEAALEQLALDLNELAYRAGKAETERQRCLIARLFAGRLGEEFAGNVVAVKGFGLIVQLRGLGISGTLAARDLPDGPYRLEEELEALVGPKRQFAVGAPIDVVISATDEALGRLELKLR